MAWGRPKLLWHAADARKGQKIAREEITSRPGAHPLRTPRRRFQARHLPRARRLIEIYPTYDDFAYRVGLWGDEIESLNKSTL